jgi:hypothetical protein
MVSGRKLDLPCNLLFGASPDKEQPTSDYMVDLMEWLHDIHNYDHQHLKVASNQMNTCYNHLVNSVGFQRETKSGCTTRPRPEGSLCGVAVILGRPLQVGHLDLQCSLHDPALSQGEDDRDAPGQTGTVSRGYLGQAA